MVSGRLAGFGLRSAVLWSAAAAAFAVASPLQAQQLVSVPASHKIKPADEDASAEGRDHPHQVHHRSGAPCRFRGFVADESQPRARRVARSQAGAARRARATRPSVSSSRSATACPPPARRASIIDVTGPVVVEKADDRERAGRQIRQADDRHRVRVRSHGRDRSQAQPCAPARSASVPQACSRRCRGRRISPQARAAGSYKPVIVIDPGHGGDDSGRTKFGTVEKNVVLSFSLKLREKLNATGRYKVLMTRDTDMFVPLEERREFAERNQAALFIAIHADYTARASARGATIYSLRRRWPTRCAARPRAGWATACCRQGAGAVQEGRRRRRRRARACWPISPGARWSSPRAHQRVRRVGDQLHGRAAPT